MDVHHVPGFELDLHCYSVVSSGFSETHIMNQGIMEYDAKQVNFIKEM
jgi:hypothetical protein